MRNNNKHDDVHRAALLVSAGERQVARQKRLLAKLAVHGQSTSHAKTILSEMEQKLLVVRNYQEVLRSLNEISDKTTTQE